MKKALYLIFAIVFLVGCAGMNNATTKAIAADNSSGIVIEPHWEDMNDDGATAKTVAAKMAPTQTASDSVPYGVDNWAGSPILRNPGKCDNIVAGKILWLGSRWGKQIPRYSSGAPLPPATHDVWNKLRNVKIPTDYKGAELYEEAYRIEYCGDEIISETNNIKKTSPAAAPVTETKAAPAAPAPAPVAETKAAAPAPEPQKVIVEVRYPEAAPAAPVAAPVAKKPATKKKPATNPCYDAQIKALGYASIAAFQIANGIAVDCTVGPETAGAIKKAVAAKQAANTTKK